MGAAPCKDCKDRRVGCHADCSKPELVEWQNKQERIKANRREAARELQDYYYKDNRYRKLRLGNHD